MKIFTVNQIHAADAYTIEQQAITSDDLMERAAMAFTLVFTQLFKPPKRIFIFCGTGNNGGDGLCIARLLHHKGYEVKVYILRLSNNCSPDFLINEQRLKPYPISVNTINTPQDVPSQLANNKPAIVIDALFGSGLNRPLKGLAAQMVLAINSYKNCTRIAVDVPSGLFADKASSTPIIQAQYTLTFQWTKLAFMFSDNFNYVGHWQTLDIGLHQAFEAANNSSFYYLTSQYIKTLSIQRTKFAHKGSHGRALVIGGSYGKVGACVLMAKAALKGGVGLLTAYTPKCAYPIMQNSCNEAMLICDNKKQYISQLPSIFNEKETQNRYDAIAIGPGLGLKPTTQKMVKQLLQQAKQPLVIDADALNAIAQQKCLADLPPNSILTPHLKEFDRLVGDTAANSFERLQQQQALAQQYRIFIVLKGSHTSICCPDGSCYFNATGNPYMATAGSGDVLTGFITAFLAQGYSPKNSALLGVYLHGQAGDIAHKKEGNIIASDLIKHFKKIPHKI